MTDWRARVGAALIDGQTVFVGKWLPRQEFIVYCMCKHVVLHPSVRPRCLSHVECQEYWATAPMWTRADGTVTHLLFTAWN